MAIRTIPYGYEFSNAKRVVNPFEASIVKEVFERYIKGEVFKDIADSLTERGVTYYLDNQTWNKNMISRMVDDIRYVGNDEYPSIVTPEVYELANKKRAEKSAKKVKLPDLTELIKSKLVCAQCGSHYTRRNKWRTREKWFCACGCKTSVYLDDKVLFENIESAMKSIGSTFTAGKTFNEYVPSPEIQKRENEIDRIKDIDETNCDQILEMVLECASMKYDCVKMQYNQTLDKEIRQLYLERENSQLLDMDVIKETISAFYVQEDGTIDIELKSGAKIQCA